MSEEQDRKLWHDGFYASIKLELRRFADKLKYIEEHTLGKEPLKVDMIIIKKMKDAVIENEVGRIFREYNIFEYKSPDDGLTIDDFAKAVSYALLFKSLSDRVNDIKFDELTVSLVRDIYPRELFKELERLGSNIAEEYPGIYYVDGMVNFPVQIIVTSKLRGKGHSWLKIVSNKAQEEDVREALNDSASFEQQGDKLNASAVLNLSSEANSELYYMIRSEWGMTGHGLWELFKEDTERIMEQGIERGRQEGRQEGREEMLAYFRRMGISEDIIKNAPDLRQNAE